MNIEELKETIFKHDSGYCLLCGTQFKGANMLKAHLRNEHNINSLKDYFDEYMCEAVYGTKNPLCPQCGKELPYSGLLHGHYPYYYGKFCNRSCQGSYQGPRNIPLSDFRKNSRESTIRRWREDDEFRKRFHDSQSSYMHNKLSDPMFVINKDYGTARGQDERVGKNQDYKYFYIVFDDNKFKIGITLKEVLDHFFRNHHLDKYKDYYAWKGPKSLVTDTEYEIKCKFFNYWALKPKELWYTETFRKEILSQVLDIINTKGFQRIK